MNMKNVIVFLLSLTLGSLWLLNFSSGIIGGLWLVFSGGISLIIWGFLFSLVMPTAYTFICFLPSLPFTALLKWATDRNHKIIAYISAFLLSGFNNFILAIWSTSIFGFFIQNNNFSLVPLLLWGYSVVMSPISYMARREGPNAGQGTYMAVLFTQLSYLVLTINLLLGGSAESGYLWVWLLLFIFTISTMWAIKPFLTEKEEASNEYNVDKANSDFTIENVVSGELDPLVIKAMDFIIENNNTSISVLQDYLKVGYARTGRIYDLLRQFQIVGPDDPEHNKHPEVIIKTQTDYDNLREILEKNSTVDDVLKDIKKYKNTSKLTETVWSCDFCNKEFKTKKESSKHEKICTSNPKNKKKKEVYCVKCGDKNPIGANFCKNCGNKIIS